MDLPTDKVKKLSITLKEAIEIDNYGQRMEACENYKQYMLVFSLNSFIFYY